VLSANTITNFKLGLLLCDHVPDELASTFTDYPDMFSQAFASTHTNIEWYVFDVTKKELPIRPSVCDGYLISGSRCSVNGNEHWLLPLLLFSKQVHDADVPIVGLCFGLQILAKALKGKVEKARQGWGIGHKQYRVHANKSELSLEAGSSITVPVCHQDQITRIPTGAIRIASNGHCENFMILFDNHTLGIQGHPEFDDRYLDALIEYKKSELADVEYRTAKQSTSHPADSKMLRKVILDFLLQVAKTEESNPTEI